MTASRVSLKQSQKEILKEPTFMTSAATAADPHQGVQECVSLIAGLHGQIDSVLIAAGVDTIRHVGINDLFENILGACQPSFCAHNNKCGWFIDSLKYITRTKVGSRILSDDLCILTTGLFSKVKHWTRKDQRLIFSLTRTMPLPHRPAHWPPMNETHSLWPQTLGPTDTLGFILMLIRKSSSSDGAGI